MNTLKKLWLQVKSDPTSAPNFTGKDTAALELLERWRREDITGDPAAIARAEAEVKEFIESMNRNRVEAGEAPSSSRIDNSSGI